MVAYQTYPKPPNGDYGAYRENNKPKRIYWKYVAGPKHLDPIQLSELVYDEHDYRIRQIVMV